MAYINRGEIWRRTKDLWFYINRPDEKGFYYCHYCNKPLTDLMVTLDHIKQASRYPDTRYDVSNLVACCENCNKQRGDTDYSTYKRRIGVQL